MYLYLGNNMMIRKDGIIGVFDLDNASQSHITRAFLAKAETAGAVVNGAGAELPKSFLLTDGPGPAGRVLLCQMNTSTLWRRWTMNPGDSEPAPEGDTHGQ